MPKKPDLVAVAKAELEKLQAERERIAGQFAEIAAERDGLARAGLKGDEHAKERLQQLKQREGELTERQTLVEIEIGHANRDLATTVAAVLRERDIEAAKRRKVIAESLRAAGERADRGAREFTEALAEIEAITRDPDAAEIKLLDWTNLRVLVAQAAHTAYLPVHHLMVSEDRHMPSIRITFGKLLGDKADHIDAEADQVIAEPQKEAA